MRHISNLFYSQEVVVAVWVSQLSVGQDKNLLFPCHPGQQHHSDLSQQGSQEEQCNWLDHQLH